MSASGKPTYRDASKVYQDARAGDVPGLVAAIKSESYVPRKMEVQGSTPLHAASFYGHSDCVAILLHRHGDPNLKNARFSLSGIQEAGNDTIQSLLLQSNTHGPIIDLGNRKGPIPPEPVKPTIPSTDSPEFKKAAVEAAAYFERKRPDFPDVAELLRKGADDPDQLLVAYTAASPFYSELNEALRKNVQHPPELREFVEKVTNALAAAMGEKAKDGAKSEQFHGSLYRGQHMGSAEQKLMKPDFQYALRQFTSTSNNKEVAIAFAENTLVVINGIGDEKEYYGSGEGPFPVSLEALSKFEGEKEVLFPPGTGFTVNSVRNSEQHGLKDLFTVTQSRMAVLPHLKDLYAKQGLVFPEEKPVSCSDPRSRV